MVIKVKVTVNGSEFSFEGDAAATQVLDVAKQWLTLQEGAVLQAVQDATAEIRDSNDSLADVVAHTRPSDS